MKVLVTGAAGFIGFHVAKQLARRGDEVTGIDNLNSYYSVDLKRSRLLQLADLTNFKFVTLDLKERSAVEHLFETGGFQKVVHLAAQAGVRYSLENPHAYGDSNLTGFLNVLEGCRGGDIQHLVYASSSSVYGGNTTIPFSVKDVVDHPVSLYAATKKANELMAHAYSHLFRLPTTGLRFFTVYGPWGRPDMAYFLFTRALLANQPIRLFNGGEMYRDFTYIDDVVEGVIRTLDCVAAPDPAWTGAHPDPSTSSAPYRVYNIGNSAPVHMKRFVEVLEGLIGRTAVIQSVPMQPGDVPATFADVQDLERAVGYRPCTQLENGLAAFVDWYRSYYSISP